MKFKAHLLLAVVMGLSALSLSLRTSAQEGKKEHHHYKLIEIGTFGGPSNSPQAQIGNTSGHSRQENKY